MSASKEKTGVQDMRIEGNLEVVGTTTFTGQANGKTVGSQEISIYGFTNPGNTTSTSFSNASFGRLIFTPADYNEIEEVYFEVILQNNTASTETHEVRLINDTGSVTIVGSTLSAELAGSGTRTILRSENLLTVSSANLSTTTQTLLQTQIKSGAGGTANVPLAYLIVKHK